MCETEATTHIEKKCVHTDNQCINMIRMIRITLWRSYISVCCAYDNNPREYIQHSTSSMHYFCKTQICWNVTFLYITTFFRFKFQINPVTSCTLCLVRFRHKRTWVGLGKDTFWLIIPALVTTKMAEVVLASY